MYVSQSLDDAPNTTVQNVENKVRGFRVLFRRCTSQQIHFHVVAVNLHKNTPRVRGWTARRRGIWQGRGVATAVFFIPFARDSTVRSCDICPTFPGQAM